MTLDIASACTPGIRWSCLDSVIAMRYMDQLDMMNPASTGYETSYSEAGTLFSYWVYGYGQYNHLTIAPEEA